MKHIHLKTSRDVHETHKSHTRHFFFLFQVEKVVPDCGHKVKVECSREVDRWLCNGKCPRSLPCGHPCSNKCKEQCTQICKVPVECSITGPCGHVVKQIECYYRDTGKGNDFRLVAHCLLTAVIHCFCINRLIS